MKFILSKIAWLTLDIYVIKLATDGIRAGENIWWHGMAIIFAIYMICKECKEICDEI